MSTHSLINARIHLANLNRVEWSLRDYYKHFQNYKNSYTEHAISMLHSHLWFKLDESHIKSLEFLDSPDLVNTVSGIYSLTNKLKEEVSKEEWQEIISKLSLLWEMWNDHSGSWLGELTRRYDQACKHEVLKNKVWSHEDQVVFHSIKLEYIKEILSEKKIRGRTTQRYWADGKRRQDHEEDYKDSFWMKGISTTRNLTFAVNWAAVTLVLDLTKIKQKKEVIPYAWNFQMKTSGHNKKETEEFVVLSKKQRKFKNCEDPEFMKEYQEAMNSSDPEVVSHYKEQHDKFNSHLMKEPEGELDISKVLMGVILKSDIIDIYGIDNEDIQYVLNHPLFLGMLPGES